MVGQDDMTAREALLRWARRSTARYPGVRVNDFTSSWRDGLAFSALIHRNRPDLLDWRKARSARPRERLETAFHVVEKEYGVTRLLDPEGEQTNHLLLHQNCHLGTQKFSLTVHANYTLNQNDGQYSMPMKTIVLRTRKKV